MQRKIERAAHWVKMIPFLVSAFYATVSNDIRTC